MRIFLIVIFGLSLLTCSKDNPSPRSEVVENGIVVEKKPYWKKWTSDNGTHTSGASIQFIHNGGCLVILKEDGKDYLVLLDARSGEEIWRWRDLIGNDTRMDFFFTHRYENYFVYQSGPRTYCIDLDAGETLWSAEREGIYQSYISGFREHYYVRGYFDFKINGKPFSALHLGDVRYPELKQWIHPDYDTTGNNPNGIGSVSSMRGFEYNGEDFIVMSFGEANEDWVVRSYCALYNISREEWVYDRQELEAPHHPRNSVDGMPIIVNDMVYFAMGHHIVCHDLWTGEQIWRFDSNGNFVFGGFIVEDGRVYAQSEGDALWCLDALTGDVLWRGPAMGTTSKMVTLNGILYISEGGYLYALDMVTGEVYWKLNSPDEDCCGENFKREINVLPGKDGEKGLVLTSTYLSAVAYEAVR